jgi:SPP1 gp7 family putative phage head morphogenesis protein
MADLINQEVVNNIVNSKTFIEALKNLPIDTKAAIEEAISQGFEKGLGIQQIVSNITKALGSSIDRADRVIRTESHRLASLAHQQELLDAQEQGVDTKMQLLAVLDDRTRPQSASMDGKLSDDGRFKYPDGTVAIPGNTGNPAYDINDRERAIQIIDDISPALRRTREDGIIPFQNYETWAKEKGLEKNVYGVSLFP